METLAQIELLKKAVAETYRGLGYNLIPRYPYCIVRVLPKEFGKKIQADDGREIILYGPDKTNKPNYEGIVLRTFSPHPKEIRTCETCHVASEFRVPLCSVEVGDHVLFPHFEGIPIPRLDNAKGDYRMIDHTKFFAVLEYKKEPLEDQLTRMLQECEGMTFDQTARRLLEKIDVMPKIEPMTLSGV